MKAKKIKLLFAVIAIAVSCMLASCTVYGPPVGYGQRGAYRPVYYGSSFRIGYNGGHYGRGSHYGGGYHGGGHYGGGHHGGGHH